MAAIDRLDEELYDHDYGIRHAELTLNTYQRLTNHTAVYKDSVEPEHVFEYLVLGLVGEAGELANRAKKVLRGQPGDEESAKIAGLIGELGDVLWYLAQLAEFFGSDLEDVAQSNLRKLSERMKAGTIGGSGEDR